MFPNTAKSTKVKATISNIPLFSDNSTNENLKVNNPEIGDMRLFDNYIRSISTPEKVVTDLPSYYQNGQQINQDPTGNRELFNFSIEFVVDEDWVNYASLVRWWKWIRGGKVSPAMFYKNFNINEINLHFMDNQKRVKYTEKLRYCALQSISGIVSASDTATELVFTASFIAQHLDFILWNDYESNSPCIVTTEEVLFSN